MRLYMLSQSKTQSILSIRFLAEDKTKRDTNYSSKRVCFSLEQMCRCYTGLCTVWCLVGVGVHVCARV